MNILTYIIKQKHKIKFVLPFIADTVQTDPEGLGCVPS